jgi:hypothetical protein
VQGGAKSLRRGCRWVQMGARQGPGYLLGAHGSPTSCASASRSTAREHRWTWAKRRGSRCAWSATTPRRTTRRGTQRQ